MCVKNLTSEMRSVSVNVVSLLRGGDSELEVIL
jgi:hypothetical protein